VINAYHQRMQTPPGSYRVRVGSVGSTT